MKYVPTIIKIDTLYLHFLNLNLFKLKTYDVLKMFPRRVIKIICFRSFYRRNTNQECNIMSAYLQKID